MVDKHLFMGFFSFCHKVDFEFATQNNFNICGMSLGDIVDIYLYHMFIITYLIHFLLTIFF